MLVLMSLTEWVVAAPVPPTPLACSSFGAATADGWVYVYGGHVSVTHTYSTAAVTGQFQRLNCAQPTAWEPLPSGPALQGLALVAHAGKIYRVGGMAPRNAPGTPADNHSTASCTVYDPATRVWAPLPDLPAPRSSHDAVVVGQHLFVVGGWHLRGKDRSVWHDTSLLLDLHAKEPKWEALPQPWQRRAFTAAVHAGKVYVVGGLNEDAESELTVNVFDPVTRQWAAGPDLPGPNTNGFSAATWPLAGQLYASPADGIVYRLADQKWTRVGTLAVPRIVHRLVDFGPQQLLAINGATPLGNVRLCEVIDVTAPPQPRVTTHTLPWTGPVPQWPSVTAFGDGALLVGGTPGTACAPLTGLVRVRLGDLSVQTRADLPMPLAGGQGVLVGAGRKRAAFVLGGVTWHDERLSAAAQGYKYDFTANQWTTLPLTWPSPRTLFSTVAVKNDVWLIGGETPTERGNTILAVNPETGAITSTPHQLPQPRKLPGVALHANKLFVVGGTDAARQPIGPGACLDLATGRWTALPAPQHPRAAPTLLLRAGQLYLAGGYVRDAKGSWSPATTIERFDPTTQQWSAVPVQVPAAQWVALPHRLLGLSWTANELRLTVVE
jgi:N-acetylneuraminic acid mutarotase